MPKKQILTGDSHPKTHGSSYADYTPQLRIDKALDDIPPTGMTAVALEERARTDSDRSRAQITAQLPASMPSTAALATTV